MIIFKEGVSIYGLQPESLWAIDRCHECAPADEIMVTSACGGVHSRTSLHYGGHAFDLRTRHLNQTQIDRWVRDIKEILGDKYDVIFEGDHIHVEYQPKNAHEYPS